MRFFFFLLLQHRFLLLHLVLGLLLPYPLLTIPCRYLSLLLLVNLNSTIHRNFPSCVRCGDMHLIWMCRVLRRDVKAIVRRLSVMLRACFVILTSGHGSNAGCSVVVVASRCRFVLVPRFTVPSLAFTKRSKMKWIFRRLCGVSLGSRGRKLVGRLSSYVVHLVITISRNASIIGRETSSFVLLCHSRGIFPG